MLSTEAQQSLPHDAQVALQQVDNRTFSFAMLTTPVSPVWLSSAFKPRPSDGLLTDGPSLV